MKKNFKYQVYLARNLSLIEGTTWFPHTVLTEPLCMELSLYPTFYTMAWLELRWTLENLGWQRNLFSLWRNWNKWLEKNRIKSTKIWGKNVITFFLKKGKIIFRESLPYIKQTMLLNMTFWNWVTVEHLLFCQITQQTCLLMCQTSSRIF